MSMLFKKPQTATVASVKPTSGPAPTRLLPRVIVIGAGFGGLNVANTLADREVDVRILDRDNYHGFWPLLYQVATAGLEPESIAYPVRGIIRKHKNVSFQIGEVERIDFEQKRVYTDDWSLDYDYLVISAGSTNNFFGNTSLEKHTHGLKSLGEAVQLRNQALTAFEMAARETDPAMREAYMTFVIIGGGTTGVELAGAFSELIRHVLRKDYPMLDVSQARIVLVESHNSLIPSFAPGLQKRAARQLERMGVELRLSSIVSEVDDNEVTLKDGSKIASHTVIWAAGVRSAKLADQLGQKLQRGGRVPVQPTLNLADHPEVFIVGDMAYTEDKKGQPYPQVAQVAIQQGKRAALNILAQLHRDNMKPFSYFDKGSMATIGRRSAVLDIHGFQMSGFLAWVIWLVVHLSFLIGFRNRLVVLTNWAYYYFTYDRGQRIITNYTD